MCLIPKCEVVPYHRGLCDLHLGWATRYHIPLAALEQIGLALPMRLRKNDPKRCSVKDCIKYVKARGLCNTHYRRGRLDGTLPNSMKEWLRQQAQDDELNKQANVNEEEKGAKI